MSKMMNHEVRAMMRKAGDDVEQTRRLEFVASDATRDGHGTVIPPEKWDLDRFNKNGVIFYQHMSWSSNPDAVIGRGEARVEGKELIVSVTFESADLNPLAEKVFRKLLAGTLRGVSVGFMPTARGYWGTGDEDRDGKTPTYYYNGQELLEVSVVAIPSNKNALRRGMPGERLVELVREMLGEDVDPGRLRGMTLGELEKLADGETQLAVSAASTTNWKGLVALMEGPAIRGAGMTDEPGDDREDEDQENGKRAEEPGEETADELAADELAVDVARGLVEL